MPPLPHRGGRHHRRTPRAVPERPGAGRTADCARMDHITERLTERARDAGALRAEVAAADIATLINAAAWTREQAGADRAHRLIAVARTGLFE
ncbi:hypothetical protein ACFYU5_14210 [Nocardia aobensis]|uniref:Transcriptional regulator SbtR-like C-terminal domain-containing protein n=1 Tax=Nocardia aobensis TaxID=257277 RepID=A0ABW6P2Q7_9NOCA